MRTEFSCGQIQRTVLTVEQICVVVKKAVRYRIYRLCILDHGAAVLTHLKLLHPLDVAVAGILIRDLQSECVEPVSEYLCKFLYGKSVLVRLPDLTRICRRRLRN